MVFWTPSAYNIFQSVCMPWVAIILIIPEFGSRVMAEEQTVDMYFRQIACLLQKVTMVVLFLASFIVIVRSLI